MVWFRWFVQHLIEIFFELFSWEGERSVGWTWEAAGGSVGSGATPEYRVTLLLPNSPV